MSLSPASPPPNIRPNSLANSSLILIKPCLKLLSNSASKSAIILSSEVSLASKSASSVVKNCSRAVTCSYSFKTSVFSTPISSNLILSRSISLRRASCRARGSTVFFISFTKSLTSWSIKATASSTSRLRAVFSICHFSSSTSKVPSIVISSVFRARRPNKSRSAAKASSRSVESEAFNCSYCSVANLSNSSWRLIVWSKDSRSAVNLAKLLSSVTSLEWSSLPENSCKRCLIAPKARRHKLGSTLCSASIITWRTSKIRASTAAAGTAAAGLPNSCGFSPLLASIIPSKRPSERAKSSFLVRSIESSDSFWTKLSSRRRFSPRALTITCSKSLICRSKCNNSFLGASALTFNSACWRSK